MIQKDVLLAWPLHKGDTEIHEAFHILKKQLTDTDNSTVITRGKGGGRR